MSASERLDALPGYPLAGIPAIKARLRAEGRSVLDLGAGDPGLPVPASAIEALRSASGDPALQGYGFQRGLPEYRQEIAAFMRRRFGVELDPERELLPLIGSKEGIAHLPLAVTDPGDTVLVPDPGYAAYSGGAALAGARIETVRLRPEEGFLVPPERILEAPGRLRLVHLNYPNNPTGATCGPEYLARAVAACRERGAVLAFDNAYSEIGYDGYRPPGLLEIEGGGEVGLEFHSLSKSFNMTGWRLGWACGSPSLLAALEKVKTFMDTGAYMALQAGGAAALRASETYLPGNLAELQRRRDAAVRAFRAAGLELEVPKGALYLWMRVPGGEPATAFASKLLEQAAVVLLPGPAMGAGGEGYLRAAFTLPAGRYAEVGERIAEVLAAGAAGREAYGTRAGATEG